MDIKNKKMNPDNYVTPTDLWKQLMVLFKEKFKVEDKFHSKFFELDRLLKK